MILHSFTALGALNENVVKNELYVNTIEGDFCPPYPIDVSKKIWNSDIEEWVDYYDAELSEIVLFNITVTYNKNSIFSIAAQNISVIDNLPSNLNYIGSLNYNESFINGSLIYWNLSDDFGVVLYDGENISIEFEVNVNTYGEHENYVEVFAFETGCDWDLYGEAYSTVNGVPPDPLFEKKVKDPDTGEWVNETFQYVSEIVTYKIELIYYGVYNLTNVKIVDYLPKVTYYHSQGNIEPTFISEDKSVVWWNLSEPVEDDEPLIITFNAYVWGRTGDCPDCGINIAEYTAVENVTQKVKQGDDVAGIITDYYDEPELTYQPSNIDFGEKGQGWMGNDSFDIWNSGQQTLSYTISEDIDWIEVSPKSGTSDGEHDKITVRVVNTQDMSGFYGENIKISSNGGNGSVFVSIYIGDEEPVEPLLKVTIKRGLGRSIKVNIENNGDIDINNISWTLTITRRGLIKKTLLEKNGTIPSIDSDSAETLTERPFGFGFITVKVHVTAPGIDPIETTAKGFIILRFVRLRRFL
jgi:hypothetical protein